MDGGPIDLQATCAITRVVMGSFSQKWKARVEKNTIVMEGDGYYVDVWLEGWMEVGGRQSVLLQRVGNGAQGQVSSQT